jgi:uncharacterized MnhB-related membrane protein
MLITLGLMIPLVLFALAALISRDEKRAILAWLLMALTMVPVWLLLALPAVALAQAVLAAGVTTRLLWSSQRQAVANDD